MASSAYSDLRDYIDNYKKPNMIMMDTNLARHVTVIWDKIDSDYWTDAATTAEMEYEWMTKMSYTKY